MTRQDYDNYINEINKAIVYGRPDPHKSYLDLQNASTEYITSLEARIVELGAPKSCYGCIHSSTYDGPSKYSDECGHCIRYGSDYYKPKGEK